MRSPSLVLQCKTLASSTDRENGSSGRSGSQFCLALPSFSLFSGSSPSHLAVVATGSVRGAQDPQACTSLPPSSEADAFTPTFMRSQGMSASVASSVGDDPTSAQARLGLLDLPVELADAILALCSQVDLYRCVQTSRGLSRIAKPVLYRQPLLWHFERWTVDRSSTPFAESIKRNGALAHCIHSLDICGFILVRPRNRLDHPVLSLLASQPEEFRSLRTLAWRMYVDESRNEMLPTQHLWPVLLALPALTSLDLGFDEWLPSDLDGFVFDRVRTIAFRSYGYCYPEHGAREFSVICSAFPSAVSWTMSTTADRHTSFDANLLVSMMGLRSFVLEAWNWNEKLWSFLDEHLPSNVRNFVHELDSIIYSEPFQPGPFELPLHKLTELRVPCIEDRYAVALLNALRRDAYPSLRSIRLEKDRSSLGGIEALREGLRALGRWEEQEEASKSLSWRRTDVRDL